LAIQCPIAKIHGKKNEKIIQALFGREDKRKGRIEEIPVFYHVFGRRARKVEGWIIDTNFIFVERKNEERNCNLFNLLLRPYYIRSMIIFQ
jgi:hypothetical protein